MVGLESGDDATARSARVILAAPRAGWLWLRRSRPLSLDRIEWEAYVPITYPTPSPGPAAPSSVCGTNRGRTPMKAVIAWPVVALMMLGGGDVALAGDLKDEVKIEIES